MVALQFQDERKNNSQLNTVEAHSADYLNKCDHLRA